MFVHKHQSDVICYENYELMCTIIVTCMTCMWHILRCLVWKLFTKKNSITCMTFRWHTVLDIPVVQSVCTVVFIYKIISSTLYGRLFIRSHYCCFLFFHDTYVCYSQTFPKQAKGKKKDVFIFLCCSVVRSCVCNSSMNSDEEFL